MHWIILQFRDALKGSFAPVFCHNMPFIYFIFLFLVTPRHMEFLGQGVNPSLSCNLCHSGSNAGSLTHCAGLGLNHVPVAAETPWILLCHGRNSYNPLFSLSLWEAEELNVLNILASLNYVWSVITWQHRISSYLIRVTMSVEEQDLTNVMMFCYF